MSIFIATFTSHLGLTLLGSVDLGPGGGLFFKSFDATKHRFLVSFVLRKTDTFLCMQMRAGVWWRWRSLGDHTHMALRQMMTIAGTMTLPTMWATAAKASRASAAMMALCSTLQGTAVTDVAATIQRCGARGVCASMLA